MTAWFRQLEITLTSKSLKKSVTFGKNDEISNANFNIEITGDKFLSSLKDRFVVKITNLTYAEICLLINGQFYDIEIKAGYRSSGIHTIFKGGVYYISNVLGDRKSNDVYIFCTPDMIAKVGQSRMNLSLNSGINMYGALEFLCRRAGVQNANVDVDLKNRIVKQVIDCNTTCGSFLETFCGANGFVLNIDETVGQTNLNLWNPYRKDARRIVLQRSTIILTGGQPRQTSDGLRLTLMPTFNFAPGDTIVIDPSIIDIGITSESEVMDNLGYWLDTNGEYIIYQINYRLQNRGEDFQLEILAKSKKLFQIAQQRS